MERSVVVISAGLGSPSSSRLLADQLSAASLAELGKLGEPATVHTVELRDLAVEMANNLVTGYAAPALQRVLDQVAQADALIAVTPVFSASYSGLFKTFFDLIDPKSLDGTPALLGATGGTARHSLMIEHAMRPLFGYLRARVMPTGVFAGPDDWGDSRMAQRVSQAAAELAAVLHGVSRPSQAAAMESLPFEQLLANITAEN
ncbi:FMN reductase [Psychromicrobium silvestre]|uniref:FMN reductase n=1 Tax=Psychromicrobium silvestre TaxID=1645614 RepID=A0A7Y9LVL8_9MICC|nr:FMN reductase [Psychromicrobium silvestre]NYE96406.1 FMN reductase [Psychromicrobium silvestre]